MLNSATMQPLSSLTPSRLSLLLLFLLLSPPALSLLTPSCEADFLSVPNAVFSTSLKAALGRLRQALSLLSKLGRLSGDHRLTLALSDCSELLDASIDELTYSLHLTESSASPHAANGTGNRPSDLKTWLSAALTNLDTCLDGFEGVAGAVKTVVAGSVKGISSLISDILGMVRKSPSAASPPAGGFPAWTTAGDRRLLQATVRGIAANVTVAADGSGNFKSVTEAVAAAPENSTSRYVIYIKRGVYREYVEIKKKKWNLMMVGDGMGVTVISGNRNFIDGWTTFRSATFAVSAMGFIAQDMTFENTAGPEKHQAVALRSDSDLSVFYRCGIDGYQDTLYSHSLRQFFRECRITGTVDFIFGNAAAVFQNCNILAIKPLPNQKNTITAHGRKDPNQNTGFSLQFCNVSGNADLLASLNSTATYLGRPWKQFSRTIFMQSYMSSVIRPEGWLEWAGDFALSTLFYAEYMNYGPGAGLGNRVKWPGYHAINDSIMVYNYTVAQFIDGDLWLPATGVRYISGLKG